MVDSDLSEVLDKLRSLEREVSAVKLDQQRLHDTVANILQMQKRAEFPRVYELRFPEYDGMVNPDTWLRRCELFFRLQRTEDHDKVFLAAFHMTGKAFSCWLKRNGDVSVTWSNFAESVRRHFGVQSSRHWLQI